MHKRNAGLSPESVGMGVAIGSAKSFGFCFYTGQDKKNKKVLANFEAEQ